MKSEAPFKRPSLKEALDAWKKLLAERGFPTDILWIFAENLCVEKSRAEPGGFHFGFQTRFTPPSEDALDIAFAQFSESEKPVVFYRLGGRFFKAKIFRKNPEEVRCEPAFGEQLFPGVERLGQRWAFERLVQSHAGILAGIFPKPIYK